MIVREKKTQEEYSLPIEMEFVPPFPELGMGQDWEWESVIGENERLLYRNTKTGAEWESVDHASKRPLLRNATTGEEWYPPPNSQWWIHLPVFVETDWMPTRDLGRRQTGNWNLVPPGQDDEYEFIPETDDERAELKEFGFTVTER
jgi:hypothetical protein